MKLFPLRDWLPIVEAGLAGLTVGVVPPALDQVLIGAIDRSRNPEIKLACILGWNDGVFPAPPTTGRLLSETDRTSLELQNIYLGPTNRQRIGHERYLGYIAVTRASQKLVITCAARDTKDQPLNPSPFFEHVKRITGRAQKFFVTSPNWQDAEHVSELAAPVLQQLEMSGTENSTLTLRELVPTSDHSTARAEVAASSGRRKQSVVAADRGKAFHPGAAFVCQQAGGFRRVPVQVFRLGRTAIAGAEGIPV
jgi:ATP-dependent helicase/DNAse subunit B